MNRRMLVAALTLVVTASVLLLPGCGPAQVEVPDVTGLAVPAAEKALTTAKLAVGAATEEYNAEVETGLIVGQTPAAGTKIDEGTKVVFVVSKGKEPPPQVSVPDVSGMDTNAATAAIESAGLEFVPYAEYHASAKKGTAFGQLPSAGSQTDEGSAVFVGFSLGSEPTAETVPSVTGLSKADALEKLEKDGFKVRTNSVHVVGQKKGTVVSQVPAKGEKANPHTTVVLMVSSGSPTAAVPGVEGMGQAKATAVLQDAGFAVETAQSYDAKVAAGKVISQLPSTGSQELHGTEVAIVVSLGAPTQPSSGSVPDLSGMTKAQAQKALSDAGLKGVFVDAHHKDIKSGQVASQSPKAGAPAQKAQQIVVAMSVGPLSNVEVKIPNVAKKSQADAEKTLKSAGLRTRVRGLYSSSVPKGQVMGQLPNAGATVLKNAKVEIVISRGTPPALDIAVPDVVNKMEEDATKLIEEAGLVVLVKGRAGSETTPPGTVTEQLPEPGVKVKAGSIVVIVVVR